MQVRELMSTEVVTIPVDATVADAVDRLLAAGVGSVIVVDSDDTPIGIVTETDALTVARDTGDSLADIDVRAVGHRPVVTTSPDTSVHTVARRMAEERVKKVPVMAALDLVGIITLTDIVWHLSNIRQEQSDIAALRTEWSPE